MSGGILALFGVCLGAAILELALPGDERESPKAFLRFFASLLVLVLILRPIFALPREAEGLFTGLGEEVEGSADYEQMLQAAVSVRGAEQLEAGLYDLLEREFDLTRETCTVDVLLDSTGALACVEVRLRGAGLLQDPSPVEARLKELFDCETEVR